MLIAKNIDPITGEKYFEPNIMTLGSIFRQVLRRQETSPVVPRKPKETSPDRHPLFRPNDQSNRLFEARKLQKLRGIFDLLDSDCDGLISSGRMQVEAIPDLAFDILRPVFVGIEEEGLELDFEGFIRECGKLVKKLTVTERANIFGSGKKS